MNINDTYTLVLMTACMVLGILICFCLIRAIKGPRIPDRIVAINMIGTMTIIIIAILSVILGEETLVDICLIYAMISFLAVIVITKVYMGAHEEAKHKKDELKEDNKDGMD